MFFSIVIASGSTADSQIHFSLVLQAFEHIQLCLKERLLVRFVTHVGLFGVFFSILRFLCRLLKAMGPYWLQFNWLAIESSIAKTA